MRKLVVLSLRFALRFLLATDPDALTQVLGIVYRTISAYVLNKARLTRAAGVNAVCPVRGPSRRSRGRDRGNEEASLHAALTDSFCIHAAVSLRRHAVPL
jgi:hypothetical protein